MGGREGGQGKREGAGEGGRAREEREERREGGGAVRPWRAQRWSFIPWRESKRFPCGREG